MAALETVDYNFAAGSFTTNLYVNTPPIWGEGGWSTGFLELRRQAET